MASTTDALKTAITGKKSETSTALAAAAGTDKMLQKFLAKGFQAQLKLAMPKSMTPERLSRIIVTECRRTPALLKCSPESFYGAVLQCATLGLEPGNALGHCYLLPFGNGKDKDGRANAQLIIGYRGMIDLARRSGQILSISAYAVHENDEFHYELGLHPDIHHIPTQGAMPGALTYVYAVAQIKDGGVQFEVMSRAEIEAVRSKSPAGKSGPWVSHFEEMAKKTVIRRLFKYLPVSIEAQRAAYADEATDRGETITQQDVIDAAYEDKGTKLEGVEIEGPAPAPAAPTVAPKEPLPDLNPDEPEVREP